MQRQRLSVNRENHNMESLNHELKELLISLGATVVGFADVSMVVKGDIAHLKKAVSIGLNRRLTDRTIEILEDLQKVVTLFLRKRGFRYLAIPPDSSKRSDKFISRLYGLFTHKIAATCSGLGWIGRNGLFINPQYGPRLSLATVLTDAPFEPGSPIEKGLCGSCFLCVRYCPANAINEKDWSIDRPYEELVDIKRCEEYRRSRKTISGKPNCGLCINICPFGRKILKEVYVCQNTG